MNVSTIICIILAILLIIALVVIFLMKNGKKIPITTEIEKVENGIKEFEEKQELIDLSSLELRPVKKEINENALVPITDKKVISQIDNIVPNVVQAGRNIGAVKEAGKLGKNLLECNIPIEKLAKAKGGGLRAFAQEGGKIVENAKLTPVKEQMQQLANVNTLNAVMNVGSMVVGQYYMQTITEELNQVKDGIGRIEKFQDKGFKSNMLQLVLDIEEYVEFKSEMVENPDLRNRKLIALDRKREECEKLLGQANEEIEDLLKEDCKDYKNYEKRIVELEKWYKYQQLMVHVFKQISELDYALNMGAITKEFSNTNFIKYMAKTEYVNSNFKEWHSKQHEKLKIDIENSKRYRAGLEKVGHFFLFWTNDRDAENIKEGTKQIIDKQMCEGIPRIEDKRDLYQKDVKLIVKGNKYYYLPIEK